MLALLAALYQRIELALVARRHQELSCEGQQVKDTAGEGGGDSRAPSGVDLNRVGVSTCVSRVTCHVTCHVSHGPKEHVTCYKL